MSGLIFVLYNNCFQPGFRGLLYLFAFMVLAGNCEQLHANRCRGVGV